MSEAVVREWGLYGGDIVGLSECGDVDPIPEHNAVVAALRAALAEITASREQTAIMYGDFCTQLDRAEAALADAARMRKALEKFGHHDSICEQWSHFSGASIRDPHARCSCGLTAALTALAGQS